MIGAIIEKKCLKKIFNLPLKEIKQIKKAINKLSNLHYDNGLVVKRLKIKPNIALWEARIDESKRLIFTFGKHYLDKNQIQTCIQIWDYFSIHDDVVRDSKRTRQIAGWWKDSDLLWAEFNISGEIPSQPDVNLQVLDENFPNDNWFAFESIGEEFQNSCIDPPDNLPWFKFDSEKFENHLTTEEFYKELILSSAQYKLLNYSPPFVLRGAAGSGKSIVALYHLKKLMIENPGKKIVFISKNPLLLEEAKKIFNYLHNDRTWDLVDFLTFKDLINKNFDIKIDSQEEVKDFEYFNEIIKKIM